MRDVPERESGQALLVTVPDARIVSWTDARNEFHPAILSRDARALDTREIKFRPPHGAALRAAQAAGERPVRIERATWVLERVYDNHSHWLTAHLPKLLMLRDAGLLEDALMPRTLKPAMAESLALLGIEVGGLRRYDPGRVLEVGTLTIPVTDRFDPRLLRPVRAAVPRLGDAAPHRRLYVSRAKARFRRLENEDAIWPHLAARGFEKVFLEELSFREQVRLMQEARVVAAPHGAGLTNMMFCPEGTAIVEIASLGFPNPNFYALAAAMGHSYALVAAEERGRDRPQLERNLFVDPQALEDALDAVPAAGGRAPDRIA
jgi:capsular polysaccharide biosynthesis protein